MTFYVTFGQQYRRDPHPMDGRIHPDGWVEIEASSEEGARRIAFENFRRFWSGMYSKSSFESRFFPKGRLFTITQEENGD